MFLIFTPLSLAQEQEEKAQEAAKDVSQEEKDKEENSNKGTVKPAAPVTILPPVDPSKQHQEDLKHYLTDTQFTPLLIGTETIEVIVEENVSPNIKGNIIILPDWQKGAINPKTSFLLGKKLAEHGWTSFIVQAPEKPNGYPSRNIDNDARKKENEEALSKHQEKLATILKQVTDKAIERPGSVVLLTEGQHSSVVSNLLATMPESMPEAFIILSGYLEVHSDSKVASNNLAQLELPVLDLYLKRDNHLVYNSVKLRKNAVNAELKSFYRQKQINNITPGYYPSDVLTKEILGWLRSQGW